LVTATASWPENQLPPQKSVAGMVSGVVADLTAGLPTVGSREPERAQGMVYNIITTLSLILTSIPPPPPRATPASARTRVWQREPARRYLPGHVARVPASSACPSVPASSASSRVPASSAVPALGRVPALFACLGVPASAAFPNTSTSSPVPASFACLGVPALSACPNTSASLASLHVPASLASLHVLASLARPGVPALSACPDTSASLASLPVPASSHHVGAGSNISREAKQVHDHTPVRDECQSGQGRQHLSTYVNGSFAGTYAEDGDGNSRASSFCLFST
jgi:hypothetical protein